MRKITFIFTLIICLGLAATSFAATQQFPTVSVTIVVTQDLAIDSNNVVIPTPTVADYNAGQTQLASNVLTIKSNAPWILNVKAANWTTPNSKTLSDLQWKRRGSAGGFIPFTTIDNQVDSGYATAGTDVTVDYLMKLFWATDEPGLYSANLVYTLVTNGAQ